MIVLLKKTIVNSTQTYKLQTLYKPSPVLTRQQSAEFYECKRLTH
ncbi:hypothetical protein STZ1_20136 [Bacillus subtilis]